MYDIETGIDSIRSTEEDRREALLKSLMSEEISAQNDQRCEFLEPDLMVTKRSLYWVGISIVQRLSDHLTSSFKLLGLA